MVTQKNHGMTMRFFLWSAFYLNLFIFLTAIFLKMDLLIIVSVLFSLLLFLLQKRHQRINSMIHWFPENYPNGQSFYQYLKHVLTVKNLEMPLEKEDATLKTSIQFSPNPDFSIGEGVLHATHPVSIEDKDPRVKIGSSQSSNGYHGSIFNIDIPNSAILSNEMIAGLDLASGTGEFSFSIHHLELDRWKEGNIILKLPINKESVFCQEEKLIELFENISSKANVKAIEVVLDKIFASGYSLSEMMDRKNNAHFNNCADLLQFVLKLRSLSQGKPIGIRTGIGRNEELSGLCKAMQETGIYMDFITITGEVTVHANNASTEYVHPPKSTMSLEAAIAFSSMVLKKFQLDKEVRLIAAGEINNGFDMLKLMALGCNSCAGIKSSRFFSQISDDFIYDDPELIVKGNMLYYQRNILREAIQIMENAGFSTIEKIDPKMFFRRINRSSIKNLDEIYFKSGNYNNWGIKENFIHLN